MGGYHLKIRNVANQHFDKICTSTTPSNCSYLNKMYMFWIGRSSVVWPYLQPTKKSFPEEARTSGHVIESWKTFDPRSAGNFVETWHQSGGYLKCDQWISINCSYTKWDLCRPTQCFFRKIYKIWKWVIGVRACQDFTLLYHESCRLNHHEHYQVHMTCMLLDIFEFGSQAWQARKNMFMPPGRKPYPRNTFFWASSCSSLCFDPGVMSILTASVHTSHMLAPWKRSCSKCYAMQWMSLHTSHMLAPWKHSCSKCYGMDCLGTYFTHAQT